MSRDLLCLASDAVSHVTGQALAVDGGLSSSRPVAPAAVRAVETPLNEVR